MLKRISWKCFICVLLSSTNIDSIHAQRPSRSSLGPPSKSYLELPFEPVLTKSLDAFNDKGVTPFVKYWGDFLANPVGGESQAGAWYQLLVFGGKLDLERILGWKGGSFTIAATDTSGNDLGKSVGNIFTPSQAVALQGFTLYLLYFDQQFADNKVEFKFGRLSAGSLFASLPIMALPVSGAVNGNPVSLFTNAIGYRATGKATWTAFAKIKPIVDTYFQAGAFQVNPRINNPSYHGVDFSFRRGDGVLLMAEAGWSPTFSKADAPFVRSEDRRERKDPVVQTPPFAGLSGFYEMGAYLQNFPMPTFSGNGSIQNVYGFYWQGQQMLWRSRSNPDRNFTVWSGLTYSPQTQIALLPVMAYGGVAWSGLIPGRDKDQALLNYYVGAFSNAYSQQSVRLGDGSHSVETVLELSYIVQLTKQIQFQPDLQWVIRPNGAQNIPNALVVGFQVSFIF